MTDDTTMQWLLPAGVTTPDGLVLQTVPKAVPGADEVRVEVAAISINARDSLILSTPFGRLPGVDVVPLSDVAGVIDAVGPGVVGWTVGDRVVDMHNGLWNDEDQPRGGSIGPGSLDEPGVAAEHVILPVARLVRVPEGIDLDAASTVPVAGVTAWHALFGAKPVITGDSVLVIGSGGVALHALQIAKAIGATVYAAVRRVEKGERMVSLGADGYVLTTDDGWGQKAFELTGAGFDKIVDAVGPRFLGDYLAAVALRGEIAMLGLYETGPQPLDYFTLIGKLASVRGVAVGSGRMQRELLAFLADHSITPVIDTRIPFAALADAYRAMSGPDVFGKIVIDVTERPDA